MLKLLDYNIIFWNLALITGVVSILLAVNFFVRQKSNRWEINTQKYAAYECGFEPFSETQAQVFEIQFFLVSIMFLIFDVELALMFPWAVHIAFLNQAGFWVMIVFIALLTIGFIFEWDKGALAWNVDKSVAAQGVPILLIFDDSFYDISLSTPLTAEHGVCFSVLLLLIVGVWLKYVFGEQASSRYIRISVQYLLVCICLYLTLALAFKPCTVSFFFHNYFIIDFFTQISKLFMALCLLFVIYFWVGDYMYYHRYIIWELPILLLLASWFMMLLISAFNLFSLFVSLEGLSLCLYTLAAYDFDRRTSAEAALKYFTLGTLSSGFLLIGIAFIYVAVGSLDYLAIYQLINAIEPQPLLRIGSGLIFFSFIFKLGAWPCHNWVPDVYQGAPSIITAFFSTSVKAAIFLTAVRLFTYIIIEKPLFVIVGIMSLVIGILGALRTDKIKRFIAYAAINQMGFLLLGIFVYATSSVFIYFVFYVLTTVMIFMVILKTTPLEASKTFEITFLSDLRAFGFYNKYMSLYLLIILFSMAGLPPFSTSFAKWYILLTIASQNYLVVLAITIILTIFSIYYYVRLVKNLFFEEFAAGTVAPIPMYYFKSDVPSNVFIMISSLILFAGPLLLYFYAPMILSVFANVESVCSVNIITQITDLHLR